MPSRRTAASSRTGTNVGVIVKIDWRKRVLSNRAATRRTAVYATALLMVAGLFAIAAGSANAATTTTTVSTTTTSAGPTTTTVPVPQVKIHGSTADKNNCTSNLDPPVQPPGTLIIGVGLATDGFPQPHEGDPITLSNTKLTVSVPASTLQLGIDAGIIKAGDVIPSTVTLVVTGNGTKEGSHTYVIAAKSTIVVKAGKAQPLTSTVALPNTTWTPLNNKNEVSFAEKSLLIVAKIDLTSSGIGILTVTFACTPGSAPTFLALGAQGTAIPTTSTLATTSSTSTTLAPTTATAPHVLTTRLPRTGSTTAPLLILAAILIELGLLTIAAATRGRRRLGQE